MLHGGVGGVGGSGPTGLMVDGALKMRRRCFNEECRDMVEVGTCMGCEPPGVGGRGPIGGGYGDAIANEACSAWKGSGIVSNPGAIPDGDAIPEVQERRFGVGLELTSA